MKRQMKKKNRCCWGTVPGSSLCSEKPQTNEKNKIGVTGAQSPDHPSAIAPRPISPSPPPKPAEAVACRRVKKKKE
jgi:hypothetical protein